MRKEERWRAALVKNHRRAALVGHAGQLDAGLVLHHLESEMRHRTEARVSNGELAGVGLGIIDQGLEARHRRIHTGHDADRRFHHHHDRHEVARRIVRKALEHEFVENRMRLAGEQQGGAVRRRLGDRGGRRIAARAGAVLDDERVTELLAQSLRDFSRHEIGDAASRQRDQHRDRPAGPRLRRGGARRQQDGRGRQNNDAQIGHDG